MVPGDATQPNIARMYDYWLGGSDNSEADRAAAEAVRARHPQVADQALDNKRFLTRAVTHVAGRGVRQFLDIGSGLPTSPARGADAAPLWRSTHEAAAAAVADPVVAYVDYDPVAVAHARELLAGGRGQVVAAEGDVRDPGAILADPGLRAAGLRLAAPACVILGCLLHFLDPRAAKNVVGHLARELAPGSYVIISVGFGQGRTGTDFVGAYNAQQGPRIYSHSRAEITALFDGLDLVPPGIVDAAAWRAGPGPVPRDEPAPERSSMIVAGVGRRP
jgi:O-methyltransferase involved in polyketide biosynthesis